jgi:hypothetical protein
VGGLLKNRLSYCLRQENREPAALSWFALRTDGSPEGGGNPLDNRQAQADSRASLTAGARGPVERLEDVR